MNLNTSYFTHVLFHPTVKEGIKYVAGAAAFSFGLIEAYTIYQVLCGRKVCPFPSDETSPRWTRVAVKIIFILARTSLLLSALSSRPAVFILSAIAKKFFPNHPLHRFFGPNTIFAKNPWHPRHICSLVALALALPLAVHSLYNSSYSSSFNSLRQRIYINIILSRPLLHLIGRASL